MKTAVLINDTSTKSHIGCRIVVAQILRLAAKAGIKVVATCSVHVDWRGQGAILDAMKGADLVIVNGEGTLHHATPQALALAEVASYCRSLGIPSVLINSVYEQNNEQIAEHCSHFAMRFFREPNSAMNAQAAGLECAVVPDLTLSSDFLEPYKGALRIGNIIVTDNANREFGRPTLAHAIGQRGIQFMRMDVSDTKNRFVPSDLEPLVAVLPEGERRTTQRVSVMTLVARSAFRPHMFARMRMKKQLDHPLSAEDLLQAISGARAVVAGRFHAACLSLVAGTPFVAMPSNTAKTQGMLRAAGLEKFYVQTPKEAFERISTWEQADFDCGRSYVLKARVAAENMFAQLASLASR
ncbi:polysaccharide pyruvyl transferase family protein (plasmid) [Rhizobium sullae]|uniref:Polysaccharide pyruvyl transferase family protein n=1 Tax=Rhizobium sullae TaxID=50338 RepID=A0ABY5XQR9_RHISU|nr:polysaccharide pyruvyl transferase family protein [Rhizobium sullae]UWU16826.1 polysaccharide pyruvyl transferase family protein [Rhizobium sullae]